MARPTKVGFAVRVKEVDRRGVPKYPRYEITFKNGRPHRCRRSAKTSEIPIPDGASTFYVTHPANENGARATSLGTKNLDEAFVEYRKFEESVERQKRGLAVFQDFVTHSTDEENRILISSAVEKYLLEVEVAGRRKTTLTTYRKPLKDFIKSCSSRTYLDEVTREDLIRYVAWMKENLQRRSVGQQEITFRKRLGFVSTFLAKHGIEKLWPKKEWPKAVKTKPVKYGDGILAAILKAATPEESIRLRFLIFSGCRDMEVATAEYSDIDVKKGVFHIRNKPHLDWRPKDSEERDVVLPKAFIAELMKRKGDKKDGLIFPNTVGRIDHNMIEFLQKAAKRAGIAHRVTQHMIRRTTGSKFAEKFGINNAQQLLGHADIATTAKYVAADDMTSPDRRSKVEEALAELVK